MTDTKEPWLEPLVMVLRNIQVSHSNRMIGGNELHRRLYPEEAEECARAAYAELERQGLIGIHDDPNMDATDGAHPAWWRGEEYGAMSVARRVLEMLKPEAKGPYNFSAPELNEIVKQIAALRANQRTPGTVEVCRGCGVGPIDLLDHGCFLESMDKVCPIKGAP